jgi:hypothetical protein
MLDSKIPAGPLDSKWTKYKGNVKLVNPANKRKLEVIIVGTGLAGSSVWVKWDIRLRLSAFRIHPGEHTLLLPKGVSMQLKIIKTMVILFTVFFMIPLKVETTGPVREMYTG